MEMVQNSSLSRWFYLGLLAIAIGVFLIYRAKGQNKSKLMENGIDIIEDTPKNYFNFLSHFLEATITPKIL